MTQPRHLQPIEQEVVDALTARAAAVANCNLSITQEIRGFREDRTPWDAMRLANALAFFRLDKELVSDLDQLAFDRAGLVPSNREQPQ